MIFDPYLPAMREPPKFDPFSRPGDGRGDAEMRQQHYESLLKQAGTDDITYRQRKAMIESATGLMMPGIQQGNYDLGVYKAGLSALPGLSQLAQQPARTPLFDWSSALPAYQRLGQERWKDDDQNDDEDRRMAGIFDPGGSFYEFMTR